MEGGALVQRRAEGGRVCCICVLVGMGEDQFCADLVGPGAAEDLVIVRDYRVARVEAEELDSLVGQRAGLGTVERRGVFFVQVMLWVV